MGRVKTGRLRIALSTVTLAEVLTAPHGHGHDPLGKQLEAALREFDVHPLSVPIAVEAARRRARYRLRLLDAIQLAIALEIGAWGLVTHDRDFSAVQDVRVLREGDARTRSYSSLNCPSGTTSCLGLLPKASNP